MERQHERIHATRTPTLKPWPRRNVLQQPWTQNLFKQLDQFIAEDARNGRAKSAKRYAVRPILVYAEKTGLAEAPKITPAWLASIPAQTSGARRDRESRTLVGRLLVKSGIWSKENYELLEANLAAETSKNAAQIERHEALPNPPQALCALVLNLAHVCGLATGDLQNLRKSCVELLGLRLDSGRLIPFGNGWDEVPKELLERYVTLENPTDYLFFARSPRDKRKPISRQTLEAAVAVLHPKDTPQSLREQHFREDFNRAKDLRELRFHFRNVHGISNVHAHRLINGAPARSRTPKRNGFVSEAKVFPVPAPYLFAAICASGLLQKDPKVRPRGERAYAEWQGMLGRWIITVDWPTSLSQKLHGRGRVTERALRLLYWIAWEQWYSGRRMKAPKIQRKNSEDLDLLRQFAITRVEVVDLQTQMGWAGHLYEFKNRKRTSYVPVIETMNGAAWRNQCHVCMHPERMVIDTQIRAAQAKEGRIKGLKQIAESWKVSYRSLMRHSGLTLPVPGRGEEQRKHVGAEVAAPSVRCPKAFVECVDHLSREALILFPFILWASAPTEKTVDLKPLSIAHSLGLALTDNELSLALNRLRHHQLIANFERAPGGFRVTLNATN